MDRRSLIIGGAALIAAPAIVRFEWIMPVKAYDFQLIQPVSIEELVERTIRRRAKQFMEALEYDLYAPTHKNGHLHLSGGLTPRWSRL